MKINNTKTMILRNNILKTKTANFKKFDLKIKRILFLKGLSKNVTCYKRTSTE